MVEIFLISLIVLFERPVKDLKHNVNDTNRKSTLLCYSQCCMLTNNNYYISGCDYLNF